MATATTSVKKAFDTQDDLKSRREHCAVAARTLASLDGVRGQQVRVHHDTDFALYTVSELLHETTASVVRMGLPGRRHRPAAGGEFDGTSTRRSPIPTCATRTPVPPASSSSGWTTTARRRTSSPSRPTAATSSRTPTSRPSGWPTASDRSWRAPGDARAGGRTAGPSSAGTSRPPTSTRPPFRCSPRWRRGASPAVAFHGFDDEPGVLIGGTAPDAVKERVRDAIARCSPPGSTSGSPDPTSATPATIRTTSSTGSVPCGGIQIEQGRVPATITPSPSPTPWPTCSARVHGVTSNGSKTRWRSCGQGPVDGRPPAPVTPKGRATRWRR